MAAAAGDSDRNWPLIFAAVVAVPEVISLAGSLLQRSRIGSPLPDELCGIYDQEEYETSMKYTRAKSTYSLCKSFFDLLVFFSFWLLGGFAWLDGLCVGLHLGGEILTGLAFVGLLALGGQVLDIPWDIYFTFSLEEQFGFNKTTPATFVKDRLKALVLGVLVGGPVMAIVFYFLMRFGTGAWLYVFTFITCFQLLLVFLVPAVILPLFMEMIPLPAGKALMTEEEGVNKKALPSFLSGRVFYAHSEESNGNPCWVTNDRRFAGSQSGAKLCISWSTDRNEWLLSEGEPASGGKVFCTASAPEVEMFTPGLQGADWLLTAEAKALAADQETTAARDTTGSAAPLVQEGSTKVPADAVRVLCVDAGSLRSKVLALAERLGYHGASIYVIDGSSRSSHSNAFCTGFGSFRRICLFDTLLPVMTEGEILAVLGHEIGHDRLYHVHTRLAIGIAYSFLMLFALGHFLSSPVLSAAFFIPEPKVYLSTVFFSIAWGVVDFVVNFLMAAESRANEFAADRFAVDADRSYAKLLGEALKKLMKKSKVNLTPHPFYVFMTYSHPPLDARLQAIREQHRAKYGCEM
eukprot:TRINITY_DN66366_c0_g1_i1.p1 TRINITY_DN66366_c0_g1~~TRINITY_DN66366_c0_g1_i1.p1  ORF type:complete len:589 (-),score=132.13 TRINITY_DN66366_c0_g1_i1:43-1773(-)